MQGRWFSLLLTILVFTESQTLLADVDLLKSLQPKDLERLQTKEASVYQDPVTKALTLTFNYTSGEPEVRFPIAQLGWPTDWSAYKAVQYSFHSTSLETVAIGFSNGSQTKFFITEPLAGIRIQGVIPFDSFIQTRAMTPLLPLGYKVWPQRLFTFENIVALIFKMRFPSHPSQFTLSNFTLTGTVPRDDILDKKPVIDRYGQWIPENWEGKAHNDAELKSLWAQDRTPPADFPFCQLGGDPSRSLRSTGYFRTEKVDGKWVFVDPHGHPFYSTGMDLVGYTPDSFATDVSGRQYLFETLPPAGPAWLAPFKVVSFYVSNIIQRFGEGWEQKWEQHIVERLRSWGFNTIGNWSDAKIAARSKMPYVLPLHGWATKKTFPFPFDFPDVFSKEFEENVDDYARRQCSPLKDDPHLIGWFIGNEPHWARSFGAQLSWPDMLLADPDPSATQDKLKNLLKANSTNQEAVRSDFLHRCARRYFETITRAVRKHDPNHLVLGIRFAEKPNRRWAEMSSIFDTFSINIYSEKFLPDSQMIREYAEASGRPVIIGEFTAATPGRGLQGLFYYVHKVRNYEERGKAYRYYVENAAADPHIIGTHWFQMVDDLPTGRPSDQERLNYGFINVVDLPYPHLVEAARETHRRIYDLKFGKVKPVCQVPDYN
jgi:hypothetical protein